MIDEVADALGARPPHGMPEAPVQPPPLHRDQLDLAVAAARTRRAAGAAAPRAAHVRLRYLHVHVVAVVRLVGQRGAVLTHVPTFLLLFLEQRLVGDRLVVLLRAVVLALELGHALHAGAGSRVYNLFEIHFY